MAEEEELILSHAGRLRLVDLRATYDETLRSLVGESVDDTFLLRAEISNELLDSHFTHMSEKTLQNYAQDASTGVAFLRSHEWRSLPSGYSLNGQYLTNERKLVQADFYSVRGLADTDDLIKRIEKNLVTRVLPSTPLFYYNVDLFPKGPYPGTTSGQTYNEAITCWPLPTNEINGNPNIPK